MAFNNNSSLVGFITQDYSAEEIIAFDTQQLENIGGSFDAIADRMRAILNYAKTAPKEKFGKLITPSFDEIVEITFYAGTKGFQPCPFDGCESTWNDHAEVLGR
ncbi:MAG: hypothetical protein V1725_07470, partial [archaeon]